MSASERPPAPKTNDPPAATLADLPEARALFAQFDPAWFDEANDPNAWLFEPEVQQLIGQMVEEEIAPFAKTLSPEEQKTLRDHVELALHTDPTAIEYLNRIRPRPTQDSSGKMRKGMFDKPNVLPFPIRKAGGQKP